MSYLFESVFGGFGSILLIILLIVIFVKISNLKSRVFILEDKLSKRAVPVDIGQAASSAPMLNNSGQTVAPLESQTSPVTVGATNTELTSDKFVKWLKDDWLLKLGGLLLLIGLGWFVTYAFINHWIGEVGRIVLGIAAGVAILGLGTWRIKKYINQGGIFLVIGSAIILLTVFAAREMYDMFTPLVALVLMFLSTAYIALISVKYDTFAVSLSGLVLAFVAPLLTNSSQVNEVGLFSYLLVITLGAIWIVAIKNNWGSLIFACLVGVLLYSLPYVTNNHNQTILDILIWFAYGFAAIFFLTSLINIVKSRETDIKSFLWTAVANGAFLLVWIMAAVTEEWQSSIIALWMGVFAVGSFIAFGATKIKSVFYVYAGVAMVMLVVATTIEFSGAVLIVAYTLESFLIPVLIYYATRDVQASTIGSLLIALPTFMSLGNLNQYYRGQEVFSKDFFVVFLVIVVLLALGLMYKKIKTIEMSKTFYLDNLFLIVGSVYAYILLWSMFHVGLYPEVAAVTITLVIFTIIGLIKYFYGISVGSKILRNYGGILIGFVILRLLFIDVWEMEISGRVIVFVLVGVLLMSTAFISRRIKSGFTEKISN